MTAFRLLVTEPLDGARNMALDEALMLGRLRRTSPPTLRFFAWAPPTISLGYGQRLDGRVDLDAAARMGVGLVRRLTGGSAILHEGPEAEVTYGVTGAAGDFPGADDLHGTYRWIGVALAAGLRELGASVEMVPVRPSDPAAMPAFCFARTGSHEIEVDGRKLVGSAQRRQGDAFLQHGSVMLAADAGRLRRAFPGAPDPLGGMTTLEAVLGRRPSFDETVEQLAEGFRRVHGLRLDPGGLTAEEVELAESLACEKYETPEWTRARRTSPPRPRRLTTTLREPSPRPGERAG
ncbi:MAG TPA: biotin/lipoate A/B protein ligase family protein [Candidatus Limnocylindrales bacterium]|nr:biotin/lipoate A/B protein ligase family protein [Candidatus Limnocylindrales bacterium]